MQVYDPADSITGRYHFFCRAVYKNNIRKTDRLAMYKKLYTKLLPVNIHTKAEDITNPAIFF